MKAVAENRNLFTVAALSLALSLMCGIAARAQDDIKRGIPTKPSSPGGSNGKSSNRSGKVEKKKRHNLGSKSSEDADSTNPPKPPVEAPPAPGIAEKNEGKESYDKKEYDVAIERLNVAANLRPADADIFYYLGDSYSATKQYKEAIGAYEKAVGKDPLQATAEQYFYLGYAYEVTKDNSSARKYYDKAIAKKSDYSDALTHLGNVLSQSKDWRGAIDAYQRAYDLNPKIDDAEVWFNWGFAYKSCGTWDKSIEKFAKAIDLKVDNIAEAYFLLGMSYKINRRFPEAADAFRNQLKKKADDYNAYLAQVYLGHIYSHDFEPPNWEAALEAYQGAVRLNDKDHDSWSNVGGAQHNLKNLQAAAEAYQRAVTLDPSNANYQFFLGKDLCKLEHYAEAIATLTRAVELNPKLGEAYYYRGLSYKNLRQYDQAVPSLNTGIEIGFDTRFVEGNARYTLAVSYSKLGNVAAARQQCDILRTMPSGAPGDSEGVCR